MKKTISCAIQVSSSSSSSSKTITITQATPTNKWRSLALRMSMFRCLIFLVGNSLPKSHSIHTCVYLYLMCSLAAFYLISFEKEANRSLQTRAFCLYVLVLQHKTIYVSIISTIHLQYTRIEPYEPYLLLRATVIGFSMVVYTEYHSLCVSAKSLDILYNLEYVCVCVCLCVSVCEWCARARLRFTLNQLTRSIAHTICTMHIHMNMCDLQSFAIIPLKMEKAAMRWKTEITP